MSKGLGKGLEALFEDTSAAFEHMHEKGKLFEYTEEERKNAQEMALDKIKANPNQPRKNFDEQALKELADSISKHGVIMPIVVNDNNDGTYMIIAGERRYRASVLAGNKTIPVIIRNYNEREIKEISLIENLQREDLNPIEAATAMKQLMTDYKLTQDELAERIGKSRPAVANTLRLLTLAPEVISYVSEGKLSAGHARAILAVPSGEAQMKLAKKVVADGLSVRQTESLAKRLAEGAKEAPAPKGDDLSIYDRAAEKDLGALLGRKVHIVRGRRKGRIELEYYDPDDLNALLDLLGQMPGRGKEAQGR